MPGAQYAPADRALYVYTYCNYSTIDCTTLLGFFFCKHRRLFCRLQNRLALATALLLNVNLVVFCAFRFSTRCAFISVKFNAYRGVLTLAQGR